MLEREEIANRSQHTRQFPADDEYVGDKGQRQEGAQGDRADGLLLGHECHHQGGEHREARGADDDRAEHPGNHREFDPHPEAERGHQHEHGSGRRRDQSVREVNSIRRSSAQPVNTCMSVAGCTVWSDTAAPCASTRPVSVGRSATTVPSGRRKDSTLARSPTTSVSGEPIAINRPARSTATRSARCWASSIEADLLDDLVRIAGTRVETGVEPDQLGDRELVLEPGFLQHDADVLAVGAAAGGRIA
ncbi:hypothetical protein [Nonomuraea guangzhouensis]|uniref:Uncharacterized protein n=1 Tax=Nonomuraea guangzhouensis TaxID=1291555 RepID=A0ABW4GJ40_9ACTN|nr:hypothetical protein [Nonomuraea guangzhouensis]